MKDNKPPITFVDEVSELTAPVPVRRVTLQACMVGDRILNGIMKAATAFNWEVDYSSLLQSDPPTSWQPDGLLRVSHRYLDLALPMADVHRPMVLLGGPPEKDASGVACVDYDVDSVVSLALDHFESLKFTSVGYVSCYPGGTGYEDLEQTAMKTQAEGRGMAYRHFALEGLEDQLRTVNFPVALLTVTSAQAQHVVQICTDHGFQVPDEVAVAGVWDHPSLCNAASVPITTIDLDEERMGFEAACMLERLLNGDVISAPILVPPKRVIPRRSTATLGIGSPVVRKAVKFIREHFQDDIQVSDVLKATGCGRTTLYREFSVCLGRTIAQDIAKVRVEQAKRLLVETDWTLDRVAVEVGLASRGVLHGTFIKLVGMPPRVYRLRAA